jgi:signal transduction histidine kinase
VVPEALTILGYQARQNGSSIDCDITPGLRILGSESDLRMVVTNLVLNAIHAMPKGGQVRVRGRRAGGEVVLQVSDQGIGIAPEDLGHIFLPFWTRRGDGSAGRGLGLSIVQAIVTRWRGRVTVESRLGAGCTFRVFLHDPDANPAPMAAAMELST